MRHFIAVILILVIKRDEIWGLPNQRKKMTTEMNLSEHTYFERLKFLTSGVHGKIICTGSSRDSNSNHGITRIILSRHTGLVSRPEHTRLTPSKQFVFNLRLFLVGQILLLRSFILFSGYVKTIYPKHVLRHIFVIVSRYILSRSVLHSPIPRIYLSALHVISPEITICTNVVPVLLFPSQFQPTTIVTQFDHLSVSPGQYSRWP